MIVDVVGYLRDGTAPAGTIPPGLPTPQTIAWPRGESGTLRLTVQHQDRSAVDLAGMTIVFAVRKYGNDALPAISRQADLKDPTTAGRADVVLAPADTVGLAEGADYAYDVQLTDADGQRWQIVPRSVFQVAPIVGRPDDLVTQSGA